MLSKMEGVAAGDLGVSAIISGLSGLGMAERLKVYRELFIWANSGVASRETIARSGLELTRWRSRMHALLDGGTISDSEGLSENVLCFLVECEMHSISRPGVSAEGCAAQVDAEAAASLVHARIHTLSVEDMGRHRGRICQLVASSACSVFDVARWATTTTMLFELAAGPPLARAHERPERPFAQDMSDTIAGVRRYIADKIPAWDGPRFRAKLAAAVCKRELRYDEASEARQFSRPTLESRGSVRDKCMTDAREEFIHTVDLVPFILCSNLGSAADAIRTLVEMKIISDQLEATTSIRFMKCVVALKSNRTDRGSDAIWASTHIIRECLDGFCLLSRRSTMESERQETVYITSTAEPDVSVFPFAFAVALWYSTDAAMSADPLGLTSYIRGRI